MVTEDVHLHGVSQGKQEVDSPGEVPLSPPGSKPWPCRHQLLMIETKPVSLGPRGCPKRQHHDVLGVFQRLSRRHSKKKKGEGWGWGGWHTFSWETARLFLSPSSLLTPLAASSGSARQGRRSLLRWVSWPNNAW